MNRVIKCVFIKNVNMVEPDKIIQTWICNKFELLEGYYINKKDEKKLYVYRKNEEKFVHKKYNFFNMNKKEY